MVSGVVVVGGVLEDGVVADGPVKGGLVEAGLGDAQVPDHHLQQVPCLLLPMNRLYQPGQHINAALLSILYRMCAKQVAQKRKSVPLGSKAGKMRGLVQNFARMGMQSSQ